MLSVNIRLGEIEHLPVADNSVDVVISNCVINLSPDKDTVFAEAYRVLKPGGCVVILEFMKRENPGVLAKITDFYLNNVLPKIGGAISNNKEAYEYLPNSIEGFLTIEKMQEELENAGFEVTYSKSFSMNISSLIIARKK